MDKREKTRDPSRAGGRRVRPQGGRPTAVERWREGRAAAQLHVKERYRPVFVALQRDVKDLPGGIAEAARQLGRHATTLANKINPACLDAVPTVEDLLDLVEYARGGGAVHSIALLADRTTVELPAREAEGPREAMRTFMALVRDISAVTGVGSAAMADGRLSANERRELGPLLEALIAAAVDFRTVVQG